MMSSGKVEKRKRVNLTATQTHKEYNHGIKTEVSVNCISDFLNIYIFTCTYIHTCAMYALYRKISFSSSFSGPEVYKIKQ